MLRLLEVKNKTVYPNKHTHTHTHVCVLLAGCVFVHVCVVFSNEPIPKHTPNTLAQLGCCDAADSASLLTEEQLGGWRMWIPYGGLSIYKYA